MSFLSNIYIHIKKNLMWVTYKWTIIQNKCPAESVRQQSFTFAINRIDSTGYVLLSASFPSKHCLITEKTHPLSCLSMVPTNSTQLNTHFWRYITFLQKGRKKWCLRKVENIPDKMWSTSPKNAWVLVTGTGNCPSSVTEDFCHSIKKQAGTGSETPQVQFLLRDYI